MTQPLVLNGKEYVSSKSAADSSGYAQDYIGQLARAGLIDAQRVGGLWYVAMDSLLSYKHNADTVKPVAPQPAVQQDPESMVTFDGKDYISASRAAKLTGYHQDYVGQLARKGTILSRLIGKRWYIEREGLLAHKAEKDKLLASVQREAVGLAPVPPSSERPSLQNALDNGFARPEAKREPLMTYVPERGDLFPSIKSAAEAPERLEAPKASISRSIPIRTVKNMPIQEEFDRMTSYRAIPKAKKAPFPARNVASGVLALTIVIMLGYGVYSFTGSSASYAVLKPLQSAFTGDSALTASAWTAIDAIGARLERVIAPEMVYRRE